MVPSVSSSEERKKTREEEERLARGLAQHLALKRRCSTKVLLVWVWDGGGRPGLAYNRLGFSRVKLEEPSRLRFLTYTRSRSTDSMLGLNRFEPSPLNCNISTVRLRYT